MDAHKKYALNTYSKCVNKQNGVVPDVPAAASCVQDKLCVFLKRAFARRLSSSVKGEVYERRFGRDGLEAEAE